MFRFLFIGALVLTVMIMMGCGSNADTSSDNISKDAEQFKVERRIIVTNGITDKVQLQVTGFCSIENGETMAQTMDLICKDVDGIRKHMVILSDNTTATVTQIKSRRVSEYRTKFIFRPEAIIPDFDLAVGDTGGPQTTP
jgi:hypothetical protein